jgi:hypothetical protein
MTNEDEDEADLGAAGVVADIGDMFRQEPPPPEKRDDPEEG